MKIKKMTITMLVVAALAAIIGISAVSYAAWTAGNNSFGASAATGTVTYIGFDTAPADQNFGTLVPYNQPDSTIKDATYLKIASITVPSFVVTGNYSITVAYSDDSSTTELNFYTKLASGDTTVTAPTTIDNTWTLVGGNAMPGTSDVSTYDDGKEYKTVTDQKIYLILDDSNKDHMNMTGIKFTVTLNLVEATA